MARSRVKENIGQEGKKDREREREREREMERRKKGPTRRRSANSEPQRVETWTFVGRLIALIFTRIANDE